MENRNNLKGRTGIARILNALKYSWEGYRYAWQDEEAFRQINILSIVAIPCGLYLGNSFSEKILLVLPCILCIIVELLNSAIENVVDRISLEKHILSKKAKDMGSAAQFIAQLFFYGTWIIFLCDTLLY